MIFSPKALAELNALDPGTVWFSEVQYLPTSPAGVTLRQSENENPLLTVTAIDQAGNFLDVAAIQA